MNDTILGASTALQGIIQARQGGGGGGGGQPSNLPPIRIQPTFVHGEGEKGKKEKGKKLNIGDEGNKETQEKEEKERQAQIEKEKEEDRKKGSENSEHEEESEEEFENTDLTDEKRREVIDKILNDPAYINAVLDDLSERKRASQLKQAEKEAQKYRNNPVTQFQLSLNRALKKQTSEKRRDSWSVMNRKYAGTNILKPGRRIEETSQIPIIDVFFDQSGSWSDADVKFGESIISSIVNNYVRRRKIRLRLWYFANHVHEKAGDARAEGGTSAGPEIVSFINKNKPDNVIIMTDGDTDGDEYSSATIPGYLRILWRSQKPTDIVNAINARSGKEYFDITRY